MRRVVPFLLSLSALLAACGTQEPAEREPSPATDLRIVFWPQGRDGEAVEASLTCEPAGGTHRDPAAACRALAARPDALEPVPPDAVCTQIYGGPEEAEVSGTVSARRVSASFTKRNGCEIARWEALAPLLELQG